MRGLLGLIIIAALGGGCAASSGDHRAWIDQHGGVIRDSRQSRAQTALDSLGRCPAARQLVIRVLDEDTVAAWSWPDGSIFVTRRLVDALGDDELAAAIAHECGHLLADGHMQAPNSLRGYPKGLDVESRADAIGSNLLELNGLPRDAMIRMLAKVRSSSGLSGGVQRDLSRRIALLSGAHADADQ